MPFTVRILNTDVICPVADSKNAFMRTVESVVRPMQECDLFFEIETSSEDLNEPKRVTRSLKDFHTLARLIRKAFPHALLPFHDPNELPKLTSMTDLPLPSVVVSGWTYRLQDELDACLAHPEVGQSAELHDFLLHPERSPSAAYEEPESNESSLAERIAVSVTGAAGAEPGLPNEPYAGDLEGSEFHGIGSFFQNLSAALARAIGPLQEISRARVEMSHKETTASGALHDLGLYQDDLEKPGGAGESNASRRVSSALASAALLERDLGGAGEGVAAQELESLRHLAGAWDGAERERRLLWLQLVEARRAAQRARAALDQSHDLGGATPMQNLADHMKALMGEGTVDEQLFRLRTERDTKLHEAADAAGREETAAMRRYAVFAERLRGEAARARREAARRLRACAGQYAASMSSHARKAAHMWEQAAPRGESLEE
eukprot:tig00020554_g10863.t1